MSSTRSAVRRVLTVLIAGVGALVIVLGFGTPAFAVSHSSAASQLRAAGITWSSSGNCSDRNNGSCTSFDGIRQASINGIITFKRASGCAVNITAGTETGHAGGTYSPWNGYKLDISKSSCVSGYITRSYTYVGYISGWGYQYRAASGNLYTDEGNHWDILYYTCGC